MEFKKIIKSLSCRIYSTEKVKENFLGSGILYVNASAAYMFTAAHVLHEKSYLIEFFHRQDDQDVCEEDYIFKAEKEDFKTLRLPDAECASGGFDSNDVAGISLPRKSWMDKIPTWSILTPTDEDLKIAGFGFPLEKHDDVIQFSGKYISSVIEEVSPKNHRFQFQYEGIADYSDLVKSLEGISGTGMVCIENEAADLFLVGLIQSSQGKNMRLGGINAVLADQIVQLCLENGWQPPKSCVDYLDSDLSEAYEITAVEASSINNEIEAQLAAFSEYTAGKVQLIRSDIRNMQIMEALSKCKEERLENNWRCHSENERCYLLFLEAHCNLLLDKLPEAKACLQEAEHYDVSEKYWIFCTLGNVKLMEGDIPGAKSMIEKALTYSVKDRGAIVLKRYIDALQMEGSLDERLTYLQDLCKEDMADLSNPDTKQMIYNVQASLCLSQKDKKRAIQYYQLAYGVQGDKSFLICLARECYSFSMEQQPLNLIWMEKASKYYVAYLNACDEILLQEFYSQHGYAFIQCEYVLQNFSILLKHVDGVINTQRDEDMTRDLWEMKADAQLDAGEVDSDTMDAIGEPCRNCLLLHYENKLKIEEYWNVFCTQEHFCVDYEAGNEKLSTDIENIRRKLEQLLLGVDEQVDKTIHYLHEYFEGIDKGKISAVEKRNGRVLYIDVLDGLLYMKDSERYDVHLAEFALKYPECVEDIEHYTLFKLELNGNVDMVENTIKEYLKRDPSPQCYQLALAFYTRNYKFREKRELYLDLLEDREGTGQFGRDGLIFKCCSYLFDSYSTRLQSLQIYTKYREEIQDKNLDEILEMKFRHYTNDYSNYKKWLAICDFWLKQTPATSENECIDAIMLYTYNLDDAMAKVYYQKYMNMFHRGDNENNLDPVIRWRLRDYYALVNPGMGGRHIEFLPAKIESKLRRFRNVDAKKRGGWKKLPDKMDAETEKDLNKVPCIAVIEPLFLYFLATNHLLDQIWEILDSVIVPYSSIKFLLERQYDYDDPVIRNIFAWIKKEKSVELNETGFEKQVKYRTDYGEKDWKLKSPFCMALDKDIPIIAALSPDDEFARKAEIQSHLIWGGDFYGELLRLTHGAPDYTGFPPGVYLSIRSDTPIEKGLDGEIYLKTKDPE